MTDAGPAPSTGDINGRRMAMRIVLGLGAAALVWFSWPRPDAIVRVALGGVATVTDALGRSGPLTDTLFIGGDGARRTVRVENLDTVSHVLALFSVDANSQHDFSVPPGVYEGACSAHRASTLLTVVVR